MTKRSQVCVEALEVRSLMTAAILIDIVGSQMPLYDIEMESAEPGSAANPQQWDPSFRAGEMGAPAAGNGLASTLPPPLSPILQSGGTSASPLTQALSQPGAWANFDRDAAFMDLFSRNDEPFDRARLPGMPPDDMHGGPDFHFGPGAFGGAFALGMPPGFGGRDGFRPNGLGDRNDWVGGSLTSGSFPALQANELRFPHRLFEARELLVDAGLKLQPSSFADAEGSSNTLNPQHGIAASQQPPVLLHTNLRDKAVVASNVGAPMHVPTNIPSPASLSHGATPHAGSQTLAGISRHKSLAEPYDRASSDGSTTAQAFARWVDAAESSESSIVPESMLTLQQYLRVDWPGLDSRLNDFIAQLEAFGAGTMSEQSQPYASLTWVSLMAVVTVVLELARRQNQVPALDQDAYGMLNDRSSARRRTAPGESDFVT